MLSREADMQIRDFAAEDYAAAGYVRDPLICMEKWR